MDLHYGLARRCKKLTQRFLASFWLLLAAGGCGGDGHGDAVSASPDVAELDAADTQNYGLFEWQENDDVAYGTVRNYLPESSECFLPLASAPPSAISWNYATLSAHAKAICGTCWTTQDVSCGGGRIVDLSYNGDDNLGKWEVNEVWWFNKNGEVVAYYKLGLGATAECPRVVYGSVTKYCNPLWGETGDLWYYAEPTCPYDADAGWAPNVCDVDAASSDQ